MNYVWEVVLQAERSHRMREGLRFVEASNPSPYIEVSLTDLNLKAPEDNRVEINPLYRFGNVFGQLFDRNIKGLELTREIFFDVCMHYIVQLDLREGLSREDYYYSMILEDISNGRYGLDIRERFGLFDEEEKKTVIYCYQRFLKTGNYLEEFKKVTTKLFRYAHIYKNNEADHELLVYLGVAETEKEKKRAIFLQEMFLPFQETVYFFYGHHFGIFDVDETMVIDETVLF